MTATAPFIHLHVHSDFSLSRGASKVKALVAEAKKHGMPALALTDAENMFGAFEFSKTAGGAGMQPIIGLKIFVALGEKVRGSVILLAQSERGYVNICTHLAKASRPGGTGDAEPSGDPVLPFGVFEKPEDFEGVICLTGGEDGVIRRLIENDGTENAAEFLRYLMGCFGDRVYVEVCRNGVLTKKEADAEDKLLDVAYECGAPLAAATEVWYATEDRHDAFEIMHAVSTKGAVSMAGKEIIHKTWKRFHLRSSQEMQKMFQDLPEAYENTLEIARRCAFMVKGRKPILPPFQTEGGRTEAEELRIQAKEGLEGRFLQMGIPDGEKGQYWERLDYELGVIEKMGFPGYFLIVSDFMKWAIAHDIPVGPGRGSGAGSLVAYSLQITDLNPLRFGLLFERFLNPDRVSMPDFDIDFCQDRRGEVIRYVQERYGVDQVSQIVTFMEIKSKTALKDVGRVIAHDKFGGYGYGELDFLGKQIPKQKESPDPEKLQPAYDTAPNFRRLIDQSEKMKILFANALKVEGLYRSSGMHAAGVIIGGQPLHELVPVGWDHTTNLPFCQYNMKGAEAVGLVKFDFLGLKTLSVLKEALRHIKNTRGLDIDLATIPLDDPAVFEMLAKGKTNGVFQFESGGMKDVLRDVKPTRVEDLIAVNALYRPGPMDMIPHYAACKNGEAVPHYPEPAERTKPFLEETFGIMVYQEQVMQVAQVVAGYSLGGADLLRRAMGKKIQSEMDQQREMFVKGAVERGTSKQAANELFDHIAKFAGYGFNKSHAAAYAVIAYRTAWLKRHYPAEFFAALLTYETASPERMALIKEDMDDPDFGVPMLQPDINLSYPRFVPERIAGEEAKWGIRFGLTAIKGISGALDILVSTRVEAGPFKSLTDFHSRAGSQFNKAQLVRLTEAGAFDKLGLNRARTVSALEWLSKHGKSKKTNQTDLFGGTLEIQIPAHVTMVPEWGNIVDKEYEAVGFYFNRHPIDAYVPRLKLAQVSRRSMVQAWMVSRREAERSNQALCAIVNRVDTKTSANGREYVTAWLSEQSESYPISFFESRGANKDGKRMSLYQIRAVLDAAKASKKPTIIIANFALEENGKMPSMFGNAAHDIDIYLNDIRSGSFEIEVSQDTVLLNVEEQKLLREIGDQTRKQIITETAAAEMEGKLRKNALARKIEDLRSYLMTKIRDDAAKESMPVSIVFPHNGKKLALKLDGKYRMTMASETAIKSMDGVVSITEAA